MATQLFFRGGNAVDWYEQGTHRGDNLTKLDGSASGWSTHGLHTSRGGSLVGMSAATVAGPTNGVEVEGTSGPVEWISDALDAGVTISGTITLNIWALESNMSANVAINVIVERLTSQGTVASTIAQTARTTELGTTAAAANFTVTPTSTAMSKGDRIRVRIYGDDAGTMATGFSFTVNVGGPTGGANGDSYISFNETFGFLTSAPGGSTLYLTDVAGPAVGSNIEKEMWTSRGDGVNSIVVNTAAGWTSPIQWTDSAGGTPVEWYSKQLQSFTLAGRVDLNLRALESAVAADAGIRAELAVCDGDGSGATVWAAATLLNAPSGISAGTTTLGELRIPESAVVSYLAGDDVSVAGGQRLRLRVFIDDMASAPLVTGQTATLYYDGTSGGASGDSYITLSQSVTAFANPDSIPFLSDRRTPRRRTLQRI